MSYGDLGLHVPNPYAHMQLSGLDDVMQEPLTNEEIVATIQADVEAMLRAFEFIPMDGEEHIRGDVVYRWDDKAKVLYCRWNQAPEHISVTITKAPTDLSEDRAMGPDGPGEYKS